MLQGREIVAWNPALVDLIQEPISVETTLHRKMVSAQAPRRLFYHKELSLDYLKPIAPHERYRIVITEEWTHHPFLESSSSY